jgi:hypothetical protein
VYGLGGLVERNNTGDAWACIIESHNNHNSVGASGLMLLSENGSFRADAAIDVRGNDGWTSVLRYTAEDGVTVPININQYGEVYLRPARDNQVQMQIQSSFASGPNIRLEAIGTSIVYLRASPTTANAFEIINGAYTRSLASFVDSPGTSETSMFLLVNKAGVTTLERVSLAASSGGFRALRVPG